MTEQEMEKAIDRLAALFEWGALSAATNPPEFLNQIADEIERLRQERAEAWTAVGLIELDYRVVLKVCEEMYGYFGPSSGYDGKAREALRKAEAIIAKAKEQTP